MTTVDEVDAPSAMRPAATATDRARRGAGGRALARAAALVAVGILIAGCGGGSPSRDVASLSSSTTASSRSSSAASDAGGTALSGGGPSTGAGPGAARSGFSFQTTNPQTALKLAKCMRSNGVPNFPDPNGQGIIQGAGIDPNSPQFQNAQRSCAKYVDGGLGTRSPAQIAKAEAAALAFSKCMRSHGVPDFPDPQFSAGGGVRISISAKAGSDSDVDPNSPIFQKAQQSCRSLVPGGAREKGGP